MKLHHNPVSPFARMVRVTAHEIGLDSQIELVLTEGLGPSVAHAGVIR